MANPDIARMTARLEAVRCSRAGSVRSGGHGHAAFQVEMDSLAGEIEVSIPAKIRAVATMSSFGKPSTLIFPEAPAPRRR